MAGLAGAWDGLAVRVWQPPARRTIVVIPHPDDEVLGCGGLIVRQRRRGLEVVVIAVTDGEAAFAEAGRGATALARRRRGEQLAACAVLGVPASSVLRLGLPDGRVADHETTITEAVTARWREGDLLVAPWTGDHHCDHEAVGRAAQAAVAPPGALRMGSLVWGPSRSPVPSPGELPLWSLPLTPLEQRLRLQALRCHRSQLGEADRAAVVPPSLTSRLAGRDERYVAGAATSSDNTATRKPLSAVKGRRSHEESDSSGARPVAVASAKKSSKP